MYGALITANVGYLTKKFKPFATITLYYQAAN
jgi:hypothetical protein